MSSQPNVSQTVVRALLLLDSVASHQDPPRLSDLADSVGLNVSTTARLVNTLAQHGFVRRDVETSRYRLGYKLLHLANVAQEQAGLHEIVDPILKELVDETNETATVAILQGDEAMVIARIACSNQLRSVATIGTNVPLYCTSAGHVLLAHLPEDRIDEILSLGMPRRTPLTITNREELLSELEKVRRQGYAVDLGQREIGLVGIAAPVRNASSNVIASCTISGSEQRIYSDRIPELVKSVMAAAETISLRLGWRVPQSTNNALARSQEKLQPSVSSTTK